MCFVLTGKRQTNNTDDSFLRNKKFLLTTEEVARKAPLRGGAVSPALQIQGYEEELKEMRRFEEQKCIFFLVSQGFV